MYFDEFPSEIITQVFLHLPNITSTIALASTCHRMNGVFHSSKRLLFLSEAAEAEFGPVGDIVQLLTHNDSQSAHIWRDVPISDALLHQIVKVGRIAQRWEGIYPFKKWKSDFAERRLLTDHERYLVRRAIYRIWLYSKAYHNYHHIRTCRALPQIMQERVQLLHNFGTAELAEMLDVQFVIRDMMANNICPSNGKIRQKFQRRFPESNHQLLFNIHLNYPLAPSSFVPDHSHYNSALGSQKYHSPLAPSRLHEPGAEGWGDDIGHYYVVEDMMKLDPEQVLYLKDNCPLKSHVESYVREFGDWFINNGETLSETAAFVVRQRGGDFEGLKGLIEDGESGIVAGSD